MKQGRELGRLVLAFILAPLVTPLVLGALGIGYSAIGADPFYIPDDFILLPRTLASYGLAYAYAVALTMGVPAVVLYKVRAIHGVPAFVLLGACLGGIPMAVLFSVVGWGWPAVVVFTGRGVVCGICSATAFWCLAYYRWAG